jgi:SAM-dependent methyltransferase
MGIDLYGRAGLNMYEKVHYSRDEHIEEVRQILTWLPAGAERLLDIGCSSGRHALEFARAGYCVVGVDVERFAVDRARSRSRRAGLSARFKVVDLIRDDLSALGRFDFVYSLGNVLSHIGKAEVAGVLKNVRAGLGREGLFLFDLLIKGSSFRTRVRDDYHRILWERTLDEATGRIGMDGEFVDFSVTQHFDVWGYSVDEAIGLLEAAGFWPAGVSDRLDFSAPAAEESNPFCLNFRARPKEGGARTSAGRRPRSGS